MQRINEILRNNFKKKNLSNLILFTYSWSDLVGGDIAKKTRPSRIINRVLFVDAVTPVWATELTFVAGEIKDSINKKLGKNLIKEVRVRSI